MPSQQSPDAARRRFKSREGRLGFSGWGVSGRGSASRIARSRRRSLGLEWLDDRVLLTTALVSVDLSGVAAGGPLFSNPIISRDGRFVVFESSSGNLVNNDSNNLPDVYVRDQVLGTTQLVSVNASGTASGNGTSGSALVSNRPYSISDDGRYIAFVSEASDLVANDANNLPDVFVRDMTLGTTTLVSVDSSGTASGAGGAFEPMISGNGNVVVFQGNSDDYTTNDDNGLTDVFARDLTQGTTTLVSVDTSSPPGNSGDGPSTSPSVSIDGRYVAFQSLADNLVSSDNNGVSDVFVRDLINQTTSVISSGPNPTSSATANGPSFGPIISGNGMTVAFTSLATDLVAGISDLNNTRDVFVNEFASNNMYMASVDTSGLQSANGLSGGNTGADLSLSDDGLTVVYASDASNIVGNDFNNNRDIFAFQFPSGPITPSAIGGTNTLVSVDSSGSFSGSGESYNPSVSSDGRFVGFVSLAGDLVSNDLNNTTDVFVRDLGTNTTTLASYDASGRFSGGGASGSSSLVAGNPYLSADGRFATFPSVASDLVVNDFNTASDIFLANLAGQFVFTTSNFSSVEGDGIATITVDRIGGSQGTATVDYATVDGTALAGLDYLAASGTLTFAPGLTSQGFAITLLDDSLVEGTEFFTVTLSGPIGNAAIGTPGAAMVNIIDDDSNPPLIFGDDVSVLEGDAPTTVVNLVYRLDVATDFAVTFDVSTVDGTAIAGQDYIPYTGTVLFSPGQTVQTVPITLIGDLTIEPDKFFIVRASNADGGQIVNPDLRVTILNDDSTVVTNTNDSGNGSLRKAILVANQAPGSTISFAIPSTFVDGASGVITISPASALPTIVNTTIVDGNSQSRFFGQVQPRVIVQIDGRFSTPSEGLVFGADSVGSVLQGLSIFGFVGNQVRFESDNAGIYNNLIGIAAGTPSGSVQSAASSSPTGNPGSDGLLIRGSHATIGGTTASARNVISGNKGQGIEFAGEGTTGGLVLGNYVGLDPTGSFAVPNLLNGIVINVGAGFNFIGPGNVVSGNLGVGIELVSTIRNVIAGNFVGTDATGTRAVGNGGGGICLDLSSSGNQVGGTNLASTNLVSGNGGHGILIQTGSRGNLVQGNRVGSDASGLHALPNQVGGVLIDGSTDNTIGGPVAGATNLISGNGSVGITIQGGSSRNLVGANLVGSDLLGTSPLGNGNAGILVADSPNNILGPGNLVSGNGSVRVPGAGIWIEGAGSVGNRVVGNRVGTDLTGSAALPNTSIGILVNEAPLNQIGGSQVGEANLVSGNTAIGLMLSGLGAHGNAVQGNLIGTDASGTRKVGNGSSTIGVGLYLLNAPDNFIGGTSMADGNLISGNPFDGVELLGPFATRNLIQSNRIGTNFAGTAALGNGDDGVVFDRAPNNRVIGNFISANARNGVFLSGATGNLLQSNAIGLGVGGQALGNGGFGIVISNGSTGTILVNNTNVNNKLGPLRNTDAVPITISPTVNGQKARSSRKPAVKIQAKSGSFASRSIARLQTSGKSKSKA